MRVAIVGYGRMGREVAAALKRMGHGVAAIVDPRDPEATARDLSDVLGDSGGNPPPDGYIDFSVPDSGLDNALSYLRHGATAVIGTTGWDSAALKRAAAAAESGTARILWGANFSTGAQAFFRLVSAAASLLGHLGIYDPALVETHHRGKADRPSGTALRAAEALLTHWPDKNALHHGTGAPDASALEVASLRVGRVPGIHEVRLDSAADEIRITHEAHDRSGFADGAVRALHWLLEQPPGLYPADEYFDSLFSPQSPNEEQV